MGRADRGIARELQPRLKPWLPGMRLASLGGRNPDKHLDEGKPVGRDFHFGNGWVPEIWSKGVGTPYAFSSDGKESKGHWISEAVGWR